MDELTVLKSKSYDICINARLSKTGVESLLRQRERLKSSLFVEYRKKCSSDKMAEHLAKSDYRLEELDLKINTADKEYANNWGRKEAHMLDCEITRSEIATKREELKNGI
tara:strand:- start:1151 stop:1480 length:330 start_codon:yes stop_codon:yes gene_type:complete